MEVSFVIAGIIVALSPDDNEEGHFFFAQYYSQPMLYQTLLVKFFQGIQFIWR